MDAEPSRRAKPAARPRRPAPGHRWTHAKKVLVVNDHVEVRSVITEFLRRRGFIAIPVRDADSARVVCERLTLDLVLLHLVILDIPESSLIRLLKQLHPTTPIVVVSAVVDAEMDRECRTLGSDEVLQKPIVLKQLDRTISRLLHPRASPAD